MKTLWELLWDYDPNGLLVVNAEMQIQVVNQSLCRMFGVTADQILGQPAAAWFDNIDDLAAAWETGEPQLVQEREFPQHGRYLRQIIFPVREQGVVACIMVDLTEEWKQRNEMLALKRETIQKVQAVVDKQMSVAQEITGLLGQTTAETKVSLLKLLKMVEQENA